ncbi:hypothetical protein J5N97_002697 [Dioscorea zingiberensis]|uniref:Uncharacterized protein n=1 Tax=Dioscorea zingiberensis TaxID=325984 RepID=A0A9D5D383_9LILI|nr:hypothetical protein J5N97_002697 [Dioscorea zingiberensis]
MREVASVSYRAACMACHAINSFISGDRELRRVSPLTVAGRRFGDRTGHQEERTDLQVVSTKLLYLNKRHGRAI